MGPRVPKGVEICFGEGLAMDNEGIHARVKVLMTVPPPGGVQSQRVMGKPKKPFWDIHSSQSWPAQKQSVQCYWSSHGFLLKEGREGKENRVANQRPGGKGGAPPGTRGVGRYK